MRPSKPRAPRQPLPRTHIYIEAQDNYEQFKALIFRPRHGRHGRRPSRLTIVRLSFFHASFSLFSSRKFSIHKPTVPDTSVYMSASPFVSSMAATAYSGWNTFRGTQKHVVGTGAACGVDICSDLPPRRRGLLGGEGCGCVPPPKNLR